MPEFDLKDVPYFNPDEINTPISPAYAFGIDQALKLMKMGVNAGGEQAQSIGAVLLNVLNAQQRLEEKVDRIIAALAAEE